MLDKLEEDGYIYTTVGKDGDKELILISDIIAKTLRDSVKSTK
jgi:DNA-binding PadR family transcriptional regulator